MIQKTTRYPLSWLVIGQNLLILSCMVAVFSVFLAGLRAIKVNGPVYDRIMDAADMRADILPPPLYVIETYLTAHRMAEIDPGAESALFVDKIKTLRADFDARVAYWTPRAMPDPVRRLLMDDVVPSGYRVFDIVDRDFMPAYLARDQVGVRRAFSAIAAAYEIHRSAVDRLTLLSQTTLEEARGLAVKTERRALRWTYGLMGLALAAAVAGASLLFFGAARPLKHVAATLDRLAKGDDQFDLPPSDGAGEIPTIWRAVAVLRRAVSDALHLKKTLDDMPVNVMVADPSSGVITYINRATLATLEHLGERDEPPSVDVLDPARPGQGSMLASSLHAPWHTRFKVGAEVLNLRVDAILGADGRYVAPVLTWELGASTDAGDDTESRAIAAIGDDPAGETAQRLGQAARLIADVASEANLLALKAAVAAGAGGAAPPPQIAALSGQSEKMLDALTAYLKKESLD